MKLRFRKNALRLRVNQREVKQLAAGETLEEVVQFPGDSNFSYTLCASDSTLAEASLRSGTIRVCLPGVEVQRWATSDQIGLYFDLPANSSSLRVAIEKDLECVDGPPEEKDPYAFPREPEAACK